MFEKLEEVAARFDELTAMMGDPEIASDMKRFTEIAKERSRLEDTVVVYRQYSEVDSEIADLDELLEDDSDADMQAMAAEERTGLVERRETLTEELKVLLIRVGDGGHLGPRMQMVSPGRMRALTPATDDADAICWLIYHVDSPAVSLLEDSSFRPGS